MFEKIKLNIRYLLNPLFLKKIILERKELKEIIISASNNLTEQEYKEFCKSFNDKYDYSNIKDFTGLFYNCSSLKTIPFLKTSKVLNMTKMFSGCSSLKEIPFMDTSNVVSMERMFFMCETLETIPLLNTSKVEYMSSMFYNCSSLKTIPLLNMDKIMSTTWMFANCYNLRKIPDFNLENLTYFIDSKINGMFSNCKKLRTLNVFKKMNVIPNKFVLEGCDLLHKLEEHKKTKLQRRILKQNKKVILKQKNENLKNLKIDNNMLSL